MLGAVSLEDWGAGLIDADDAMREAVQAQMLPKTWNILSQMMDVAKSTVTASEQARERIVEDTIAGESIRVEYDGPTRLVTVTGADRRELPAVQVYWFAWAAFYPETQLYGDE